MLKRMILLLFLAIYSSSSVAMDDGTPRKLKGNEIATFLLFSSVAAKGNYDMITWSKKPIPTIKNLTLTFLLFYGLKTALKVHRSATPEPNVSTPQAASLAILLFYFLRGLYGITQSAVNQ